MALKVLLLRSKLTPLQAELDGLIRAAEGFETREEELESDIDAAVTPEERSAVEGAVSAFEREKETNAAEQQRIQGEIDTINAQIGEAERAAAEAAGRRQRNGAPGSPEGRNDNEMPDTEVRSKFFGMSSRQRDAFMSRADVTEFLAQIRELRGQSRGVTGGELGIPTVMLDVLRDNIDRYSKLLKYVSLKPVKGKARQNVAGSIPEGVWTEAVASLNELNISFSQIEVDGYKVGGFLAIPNSTLEDDDNLALAQTVMDMMGQAIGYALDKAIVYGDGVKKPVGYVTRLAAQSRPGWWGENQGDFTDLHESNIRKISQSSASGTGFFRALMAELAIADPKYSNGAAVWIMNRKTHMDILARCLDFNAAGALVAGMNNTMPVIGGEIVELDFIPDYEISGGFLGLELIAERQGAHIRSSDIPLMLQDQTLFVATQRYDGKPVRGEGFVVVNYTDAAVTTAGSFAVDYANAEIGSLGVTCAAGTASGATAVTVTGADDGAQLMAKVTGKPAQVANGYAPDGSWQALSSGDDLTAATGKYVNVIQLDGSGRVVKVGSAPAAAKA